MQEIYKIYVGKIWDYDTATPEERDLQWQLTLDTYYATYDELLQKGYSFKLINKMIQERGKDYGDKK